MQVAAYADHHVLVEKRMHGDRPLTTFRGLHEEPERVAEVAAMMDLDGEVARRLVAQAAQDIAQQRHVAQHAARGGDVEQAGCVLEAGVGAGVDGNTPEPLQGSEHSALGAKTVRPA